MENKFSLHEKLVSLVEDGLSIEDAAACLGLDPDHAKAVLNANTSLDKKDEEDPDKIIEANKPKAIKKLIRIGLDDSIENISARVAALKTVIEYKPSLADAENAKIHEMYKKMQEVSLKYEKELSAKKESTTVIIPNTNTGTTVSSADFKEKFNKKKEELDYAV